ncbi:hypothetical protein NLI96_g1780 [Meripilus lineatus]|uniref:Cytochrome P450 n=1 Tax=Meripilus lineatus TaxID=2056292 RepID=A0AAD5VCA1_9APHY|nr:hypothetical protein NLI96_g1780 [Physisporinus lineatus]
MRRGYSFSPNSHLPFSLDDPLTLLPRYAASVVMSITYGKTTPVHYTDPEVLKIEAVALRVSGAFPVGKGWVDRFPFLRFFPIPEVLRLRRYHREELALFNSQLDTVRKRITSGEDVPPNVVTRLWENQEDYGITDDELSYLTGSMFGAGSGTTASALSFVNMAAALFPKDWARVQAQVDEVVGHSRCRITGNLKMFGFGYGRRVCPGQAIAERSLFINTALMAWALDFKEDSSTPIDTMGFTGTAVIRLYPFKLTATMKALVVIVNQAEAERVQQAVFNVEGLCIVAL